MEKSPGLANILDSIRYDIDKIWLNRFAFDDIRHEGENTYFVPCKMKRSLFYNPNDPFTSKFEYPEWCNIKALDDFEKQFDKKIYTIKKDWMILCPDLYGCRLKVTLGDVTLRFYWEQF